VQLPGEQPRPAGDTNLKTGNTPPELQLTAPSGWVNSPKRGRIASYLLAKDGLTGEVAVTVFPAVLEMPNVLPNVNRWRAELGLEPITSSELAEQTRVLPIAESEATLFSGEGKGAQNQPIATTAIMLVRNEQVWFFKLTGDAELVKAERERFETAVRGVKFNDAVTAERAK
jgi:hypothetical protein